jgi:hypothetical protein
MLGTPESERLKVTALPSPKRLRAGRSKSLGSVSLSFDNPLPGKPPTRPPLPHFQGVGFFILRHSLQGEREG